MKKKYLIYSVKLMLVVLVTLLFSMPLNINIKPQLEEIKKENPPIEVVPNNSDENEKKEIPSKKEEIVKKEESKEVETTKKTETPKQEENKPIETPEQEEKPVIPLIPKEKTLEEKNDDLRKSIQNKYGLKVLYGNELPYYRPRGYMPLKMTDPTRIACYLSRLDKTLAYYPNGFFREIKKKDMNLTLYLVESVPANGFTGLTDKEFYTDIIITLTTTGFFERVTNHEIMHYIDAYLDIVMYPDGVESSWNDLNPEGYHYGSFNKDYNYNMQYHQKGAYFVNNYAQTNYLEDRASVFEDIMSRAYAPPGCYEEGEVIRKKASLIADQIEKYLQTVLPSVMEHWERFIK